MDRISMVKKIGSVFIALVIITSSTALVNAQTLSERLEYEDDSNVSDILFDTYYYSEYQKDNRITSENQNSQNFDLFKFSYTGNSPKIIQNNEKGNVLYWNEDCTSISYDINITTTGLYQIVFDYYCIDGNSQPISRGIKIDGKFPFEEAKNIFLRRSYVDANKPYENATGDQVIPDQKEIKQWNTTAVYDNSGMYSDALEFAITAGKHRISFEYLNQPVLISNIYIKTRFKLPTYDQIKKEYKKNNYKNAKEGIRFEGESYKNIISKSSSSILINSDSNVTMTPKSVVSKKFNYIGGNTWSSGGENIVWEFSVPESALYKLEFRSTQSANSGMPSTRKIEIDGKVPYQEMLNYVFSFDSNWNTNVLKNNDEPYLFYLEKGRHTLSVTAEKGEITKIIHEVTKANSMLSNCYQNIVMVTGQSPDFNYDYEIDKAIPGLVDKFNEIINVLNECSQSLSSITNQTTTLQNSINQVLITLKQYRDNTDSIPTGLSDLTTALTNMGNWISTLQVQYLAIDYIEVAPPDKKPDNPKQSILDSIIVTFKNLLLSYTKDYDAIGNNNGQNNNSKKLKVWISKSKEWAETLKDIADDGFAIQNNVNLKVNLLPEGAFSGVVNTLLLAVNAGNEPDVVLNMTPNNTAEYAVRGAIYDLTQFDDFEQVKKYTIDEFFKPISYNGKVYGLPETMGFKVMLYRTDIFEKLHIKVPNTWNDVYNIMLPKLYQHNLQMYVPAEYGLFLFQNGGEFYTSDLKKSSLDSDTAIRAFEQFIGNYNDYGFPYNVNFYNRFRTGEVPVAIGNLQEYLSVIYGAPELTGKWSIAPVPATVQGDGILNRSTGPALTTVSIMMKSTKNPDLAWKFLKWWVSSKTQSEYGRRLESVLGISARWTTANTEAFKTLPWSTSDLKVIESSWNWIREVPYVPGGYFTTRHMASAISRCITGGYTPRASLEDAVEQINVELKRKREDFGIED